MDLFGEKKYEELDLLTKMIEPVTWSVLDVFAKLPDEVEISSETIIELINTFQRIDFKDLWEKLILGQNKLNDWRERDFLRSRFAFKIDGDLEINTKEKTVTGGKLYIVKTSLEVSEAELTELLKNSGWADPYYMSVPNRPDCIERAREILDLIGNEKSEAALKKRSANQLSEGLYRSYKYVMRNNLWNIRSIDLSNKICKWITFYIRDGNLAAMRNFCLVKAATHRGYPIYQIDEETV